MDPYVIRKAPKQSIGEVPQLWELSESSPVLAIASQLAAHANYVCLRLSLTRVALGALCLGFSKTKHAV